MRVLVPHGSMARITALLTVMLAASATTAPPAAERSRPSYCAVESAGTKVEIVRPTAGEGEIDDVNWFARPVPNASGHWVIAYASHDLNYLYDLTNGHRVRIPDKSDAVATPDGAFITVPSHYTATQTTNFYDARILLDRLAENRDAADLAPAFAHKDADMLDVFYQSAGVVSDVSAGGVRTTVYRLMFSGSRHPTPPGFRIVDYTVKRTADGITFTPSQPMKLCPQIVKDMATPFISKDARYVVAHDDSRPGRPASLKLFEITGVDYAGRSSTCEQRVDFGFAAGKADFSFDGSQIAFHVSKHNYLTVFISGGIPSPAITDIAVVDLKRDAQKRVIGYSGLARVTTSETEGVGNYFPAFLPDGRLFYISNAVPKERTDSKRYRFTVVDPRADVRMADVFGSDTLRSAADEIGTLWRAHCALDLQPFKPGEAAWWFMSLRRDQCRQLVADTAFDDQRRQQLLTACAETRR